MGRRDLYGSVVLFSQFIKHLDLCVFSFTLNSNLGRCSGKLGGRPVSLVEEMEAQARQLGHRSIAF